VWNVSFLAGCYCVCFLHIIKLISMHHYFAVTVMKYYCCKFWAFISTYYFPVPTINRPNQTESVKFCRFECSLVVPLFPISMILQGIFCYNRTLNRYMMYTLFTKGIFIDKVYTYTKDRKAYQEGQLLCILFDPDCKSFLPSTQLRTLFVRFD
jgi:hypothetical protein